MTRCTVRSCIREEIVAGTLRAVPPPSPAGTATRFSRVHKHRRVDTGCGAPAAELVNLSVHFTVLCFELCFPVRTPQSTLSDR